MINLDITNGKCLFIGGIADTDAVKALVDQPEWNPLQTDDGHAWAGIWLLDAEESTLGGFQLMIVGFFGSASAISPTPTRPLALFKEMASNPDVEVITHGIWTDSPAVKEFYEEQACTPLLMQGLFQKAEKFWRVGYSEVESKEIVITGKLVKVDQQEPRMTVEMVQEVGLWNWLKLLGSKGLSLNCGSTSMTFSGARTITRYYSPESDILDLVQLDYEGLNFRPGLVQEMSGVGVWVAPIG